MKQQTTPPETGKAAPSGSSRVATRDLVTIGQVWQLRLRSRNGIKVRIRQVHRRDREVGAIVLDPEKLYARSASLRITFTNLRAKYKLVDKEASNHHH